MHPTVFISYSHQDTRWKESLVRQLGVLEREGLLKTWQDGLWVVPLLALSVKERAAR